MYFESHAHYDDARFDADRARLIEEMLPAAGVDYILNCGADMPSSRASLALAERYGSFYAAVGVHPHAAEAMTDADLETLVALARHPKVVAVGEIGLDYHYDNSPRPIQRKRFTDQLTLAQTLNLPVVIHSRDATQETFDILTAAAGSLRGGVVHCYSGGPEMALSYVKMGFMIGVGGVVTFANAKRLVDTVRVIPESHLLLETDCPYLTPAPNRGQRNSSLNLPYICAKMAEIRQTTPEAIARATKENAERLFFCD